MLFVEQLYTCYIDATYLVLAVSWCCIEQHVSDAGGDLKPRSREE